MENLTMLSVLMETPHAIDDKMDYDISQNNTNSGKNETNTNLSFVDCFTDYCDEEMFYNFFVFRDYPFEHEPQPLWTVGLKIAVYVVLILVAIVGNVLVILVVIKNKRMRTTTNFYIVNLAVSDLMVTFWCSWVYLVNDLSVNWPLGPFFCKFNTFAQVTSLISSILSLTLIAFDRFFGIVFSMKAHIIERRARHALVIVWFISVCVGSPLLFTRKVWERKWRNHVERWCYDEWPQVAVGFDTEHNHTIYSSPGRIAYWTFVSLILFLIPIIAMFVAYCGIIKTLWTSEAPGERLKNDIKVQTKMKRKVIVMLVLIVTIFAICWFPVQVAILYAEYRSEVTELGEWYDKFYFFAQTMAFSNSAINPLVYAGFNDNFRQGIGAMFGCNKKPRWTIIRIDSFRSTTFTMTSKIT